MNLSQLEKKKGIGLFGMMEEGKTQGGAYSSLIKLCCLHHLRERGPFFAVMLNDGGRTTITPQGLGEMGWAGGNPRLGNNNT